MSLVEKLEKIRSPNLQSQRETAVVLSAVEDTLKDQKYERSATAYFAALLALLSQAISTSGGIVNKELATSVVYLLDLVTPHAPISLLRSKFPQILTNLAPALTHQDAEAPLLRSSIGCLESLLVVQDSSAWALPQTHIGPRRAAAGLLVLAVDHRPKVRKRAQDAITKVLENLPPSPSLDHPVADMCAETALRSVTEINNASLKAKKKHKGHQNDEQHQPGLMHALQLVKTISQASGGWPSRKLEELCEILMNIAKSSNEYLTMTAFEIFEILFAGMANDFSSSKLPRLMEVIAELQPSQNDTQLLPPWIAVISRGYDVSAQIDAQGTFQKLPEISSLISGFLTSSSFNIRTSASECLVSFTVNCISGSVILEPSIHEEKTFERLGNLATNLLSIKYQPAWMEVFNVLSALFEALKWRSAPFLNDIVKIIGELRGSETFSGKKEVDAVLGKAFEHMGPEAVLNILPLNLAKPRAGQPGRAWLLPIMRDHVHNTKLAHFRAEFIPLSEIMFQKVIDHGNSEKSMEIKIFETLVQQIWALLPGYCSYGPLDLVDAFDNGFAELLSNLLYRQTQLRADICRALQRLVETNQKLVSMGISDNDFFLLWRITKADANKNLDHLSSFAGNLLAVLFNVYTQTLPQSRGYILQCINAYLSITPETELLNTFTRVTSMFEAALAENTIKPAADKQKEKSTDKLPPTTHTLMDLLITLSVHLPRDTFPTLFTLAARVLPISSDPQLQKKAYKLLPRLATSQTGILALQDRNSELQSLLLSNAATTSAPARRDRLDAVSVVVEHLPPLSLHFIPSILSEVVVSAREVNEKARTAAFDLLVLMGKKMAKGGTIAQSQIPHMPSDAPETNASMEEYFTMVSAGLAGSTPHMISASIIALTRVLYEFHTQLSDSVIEDLVSTMDLFLTSSNREIVRSALGFVKVTVISLPETVVKPRLPSLVPGLMSWSREHKARFRAKVKHILERMIRRFGVEVVEKWCPEQDKKFIHNIRKSKERNKKRKAAGDEEEGDQKEGRRKSRFESEYDEAIYGSEDASDDSDDDKSIDTSNQSRQNGKSYIIEDSDEPLDLLDRKALGQISTTKPVRFKSPQANSRNKRQKTDLDGRLVLGESDDDAEMMDFCVDGNTNGNEEGLEGGINAYVEAIQGRDAVQRGRGGRLKFDTKRKSGEEMDIDEEGEMEVVGNGKRRDEGARGRNGGARHEAAVKKRMNGKDAKSQRRGLGMSKVRGGSVSKISGGGIRGRGRK